MTLLLNNGVVNYDNVKCIFALDEHRWQIEFNDGTLTTCIGNGIEDIKTIARQVVDGCVRVDVEAALELSTEDD